MSILPPVNTIDVAHIVAAITIGFVAVRGAQALVDHYFPGSDPAAVMRFLFGGTS